MARRTILQQKTVNEEQTKWAGVIKTAGMAVMQAGMLTAIIGALALDGSDLSVKIGVGMMFIGFAAAAAGWEAYKAGRRQERILQARRMESRNREQTFKTWMECGTIYPRLYK